MPSFKIIVLPVLEKIFEVFSIYGRGGHLSHVTMTIYIKENFPFPRKLHIKFGFDWPSGFRAVLEKTSFENDGHIHVYSPGAGADNSLG